MKNGISDVMEALIIAFDRQIQTKRNRAELFEHNIMVTEIHNV